MSTTKIKIDFDSFQEAKAVLEGELKDNQAIESFKTREFITNSTSSTTNKLNDYLIGLRSEVSKMHELLATEIVSLTKANISLKDTDSSIKVKASNLGNGVSG